MPGYEKLSPVIAENQKLKEEVKIFQTRVQNLEREARKNNVILHGIAETEKNTAELWKNAIDVLNETARRSEGVRQWDHWEISNLRRLGKKNWKQNKTNPGYSFFNMAKGLKQKKEQEEKNGKIAFIRYDKLIVKEKESTYSKRKHSQSKSPSENKQQHKNDITAPKKVNKTYNIFRSRANSTSGLGEHNNK
ncbi:unnamed protein product [Pieris macdunnoughi]|uniref:Uncharacterized protein n=1 Tax=Pieris macdunnoughi TaxID=345717 RepID=A0A821RRD4_9NEOP|nr:unnamed protein product [Pieris macdunnoughi]